MRNRLNLFIILGLFIFVSYVNAELYDDFSSGTLNTDLWEIRQDPEGQPLMDEYGVLYENDSYVFHTQQNTSDDKRVALVPTHNFVSGEKLEYDVNYLYGSGNRGHIFILTTTEYPQGDYIRAGLIGPGDSGIFNDYGWYHIILEVYDNNLDIKIQHSNGTIINDSLPLSNPDAQYKFYIESWSNGAVHLDYDNFEITPIDEVECGDTLYENTVLNNDLIDCPEHGLIIGADDITLDCNNHLIDGDNLGILEYGIYIDGKNRSIIQNCNIQEFGCGIYLFYSSNNLVDINNINNNYRGIYLQQHSNDNLLTNNIVNDNDIYGIRLGLGYNNNLIDNTINNNQGDGIYLMYSYNNSLSNNIVNNNGDHGINTWFTSNNSFINNTINNNYLDGIELGYSSLNNILTNNYLRNNTEVGIRLYFGSNNNLLYGNEFIENNQYGVSISASDYNTFWNNIFIDNNVNAYEYSSYSFTNWNITNLGNFWGDFESNIGYPNYYEISGDGNGIDWHPYLITYYIDNSDPQFSILSGRWNLRNFQNAYNGETRYNDAGTGLERAGWRVNNLVYPGTYKVYVWKFEHPYLNLMANNTHYMIYHRLGTSNWIIVNQQTSGNEWVYLGEFEFDNSHRQGVMITDEANGRVIADAVKLVYQGHLSNAKSSGEVFK